MKIMRALSLFVLLIAGFVFLVSCGGGGDGGGDNCSSAFLVMS